MNKMRWTSTALTCLSVIGVVGTAVAAAKARPKADICKAKAIREKGEPLTKKEEIVAVFPAYVPTIAIGAGTIACIFGNGILNRKQQASFASAYALLDRSYKEYKRKIEELYGEGTDEMVVSEIADDKYEELVKDDLDVANGERLFFDSNTLQFFRSTLDEVVQKTVMGDGMECYVISTPFDYPDWFEGCY